MFEHDLRESALQNSSPSTLKLVCSVVMNFIMCKPLRRITFVDLRLLWVKNYEMLILNAIMHKEMSKVSYFGCHFCLHKLI